MSCRRIFLVTLLRAERIPLVPRLSAGVTPRLFRPTTSASIAHAADATTRYRHPNGTSGDLHLPGSLTFRGELEPGAPSPLGEVVVVRDVALVQASQGFLCRQLPRLDRLTRKSRVSADYQTVIKQRLDRGDHSRLARREWLSPIVVGDNGVDIAERQHFSARHVTKQFVSKSLFAGPRLRAFWRILVARLCHDVPPFNATAARSPSAVSANQTTHRHRSSSS